MNKNIELSIIIVSYKQLELLINCIESIFDNNDIGSRMELIVVDNSPKYEDVYNYVKRNYSNVTIIKNSNNGFGEANNVGAKVARGKYLLFLNPDTIIIEPINEFAVDKFNKYDELVMFGLRLVDKDLKRNMSYYFLDKYGFIYSQLIKLYNKYEIFIPNNMFISGANIFIRKDVFINAGMFDENIFMYCEEADLTNRVKNLNKSYRIAYFKEKNIIHLEGKTTEVKEEALKRRLESNIYYYKKYGKDVKKKFKHEIRYNKLKRIIYKFKNKKQYDNVTKALSILEEYYNK